MQCFSISTEKDITASPPDCDWQLLGRAGQPYCIVLYSKMKEICNWGKFPILTSSQTPDPQPFWFWLNIPTLSVPVRAVKYYSREDCLQVIGLVRYIRQYLR